MSQTIFEGGVVMKNFIFITNGNEDIDVIVLTNYTREECFETLNRIWKDDERDGKHYSYELTDIQGNTIFKN